MTDSDTRTELWATIPGCSSYEVSSRGNVRSVDRTLANGRRLRGQMLALRFSTRGYPQTNLRTDGGKPVTKEVHGLMMAALTARYEPGNAQPPGTQVRHWNDVSDDNRWAPGGEANCGPGKPGNLIWGTPKEQWDDKLRNVPLPLATAPRWSRRVADYAGSLLRRARSVTTGLSQGRRSL
jgi:NUMOD4 motif